MSNGMVTGILEAAGVRGASPAVVGCAGGSVEVGIHAEGSVVAVVVFVVDCLVLSWRRSMLLRKQ